MKRKTETDFPETKQIRHRWPFLPNDNGRFSGPLIYRAKRDADPTSQPLLHQMQNTFVHANTSYTRRWQQAMRIRPFSLLVRHYDFNPKNINHHEQRLLRDQAAAQQRRLGILKTFNS